MNKKVGIIFVVLGIVLLLSSFPFLNMNESSNDEDEFDTLEYKVKYDHIKSHNIEDKTVVTFPVYDALSADSNNISEFNTSYSSKNLFVSAEVNTTNYNLEDYEYSKFDEYQISHEEQNRRIKEYDIECNYLCKNYKVYDADKLLYSDEVRIYIQLSSTDIAELIYKRNGRELPKEIIESTINDIKISNDATYTIGNNLVIKFNLNNNKTITIKLDNTKYEEIESGYNEKYKTTIKDKESNSIIISTYIRSTDETIANELDKIYSYEGSESNKKEISIGNKKVYEYSRVSGKTYAYLINSDSAVLVETISQSVKIDDIIKNIEE